MYEIAKTLALKLKKLYPLISIDIYGGRLNWSLRARFIPSSDFKKFLKILSTYEKVDKLRLSRLELELAKYKAV
jgi:hypothetical protein